MDNLENDILNRVEEEIARLLKQPRESLDFNASFLLLGIDSIRGVDLVEALSKALGIELGPEVIFDYRGAKELARHIAGNYNPGRPQPDGNGRPGPGHSRGSADSSAADIAIIGLAGRFAAAENVEQFWTHLQEGHCCIEEINREGWEETRYYDADPARTDRSVSKWGGLLSDIDCFDPLFFNISPLEAERMDPQQRLFLQESYKAFEDSGYAMESLAGRRVGVFVGARGSDYKENTLVENEITAQTFLGTDMAILSARVSYYLNLKGPSLTLDTACSSSLVAIHLACESIRRGESEMALAGGVFVLPSPQFFIMASRTDMLSADGKCKTFADSANGIVVGEGVGVLVLKPLAQALRDGDHIYGLCKGSAVNQDGTTRGITAPSSLSQKELICRVYETARLDPAAVSYIEAHGTGTKLGDPIEVKALTEAFRTFTDRKRFCAIGSHKPNIGHTIMTAGIAGVFKILMGMKYKQIPPTIGVDRLNRHIDFDNSPFYLNTEAQPWANPGGQPRRAGVSSFGFSGTNCHLIIEEAPAPAGEKHTPPYPYCLIPLSAKTRAALQRKIGDLAAWLDSTAGNDSLADIAYTLQVGRSHFAVRAALMVKDKEELKQKLKDLLEQEAAAREDDPGTAAEEPPAGPEPPSPETGNRLIATLTGSHGLHEKSCREKLKIC